MLKEQQIVNIAVEEGFLEGELNLPSGASSIILFAHGSSSSRLSPRNVFVAEALNNAGFATLLLNLLTREEESLDQFTTEFRFDIDLLAERLLAAVRWLTDNSTTRSLRIGLFGASTGSAAALVAAADIPNLVACVVSRAGRPDLATSYLPLVKAPTLLIVGGNDETVLELNRTAIKNMSCPTKLEIIPEATHLFEEPGKLEKVRELAVAWFEQHMNQGAPQGNYKFSNVR